MKQFFKPFIFTITFVLALCAAPQLAGAQPSDDDSGDPDAPIDGGVGILIAVGLGYGIKKIRDERTGKFKKLP